MKKVLINLVEKSYCYKCENKYVFTL